MDAPAALRAALFSRCSGVRVRPHRRPIHRTRVVVACWGRDVLGLDQRIYLPAGRDPRALDPEEPGWSRAQGLEPYVRGVSNAPDLHLAVTLAVGPGAVDPPL